MSDIPTEAVELKTRIDELVDQHGGERQASRVVQIDCAYLHRLRHGEKTNPSHHILTKLGLRRVITYERR